MIWNGKRYREMEYLGDLKMKRSIPLTNQVHISPNAKMYIVLLWLQLSGSQSLKWILSQAKRSGPMARTRRESMIVIVVERMRYERVVRLKSEKKASWRGWVVDPWPGSLIVNSMRVGTQEWSWEKVGWWGGKLLLGCGVVGWLFFYKTGQVCLIFVVIVCFKVVSFWVAGQVWEKTSLGSLCWRVDCVTSCK